MGFARKYANVTWQLDVVPAFLSNQSRARVHAPMLYMMRELWLRSPCSIGANLNVVPGTFINPAVIFIADPSNLPCFEFEPATAMALPLVLSTLYAAHLAAAQNDTAPLPESMVGWQNSSSRRGTFDIVKSCVATIVACTWSIQHLNVPGPKDGAFTKLLRDFKWMVITILLPEFIMAHAFFELIMAIQATEEMGVHQNMANYPWLISLLQRWRGRPRLDKHESKTEETKDNREVKWTLAHSYFANMGGLYYQNEETRFPLTTFQLARQPGVFCVQISEDDIKDKSKYDWFAKTIAVLQILQLVLSLIVRRTRHLAFSQLEALTLAFAVCGFGTYVVYWYKPQNVGVAVKVGCDLTVPEVPNFQKTQDSFWAVLTNEKDDIENNVVDRITNDNIPISASQTVHMAIPILALMSAGFGCLHLVAWNFKFPTDVEKLLWRIAIVLSITVPVVGLVSIPLSQVTVQWGNPRDFMRACLHVLREMSWHSSDKAGVVEARTELEGIYNRIEMKDDNARRSYQDIFKDEGDESTLRTQMISFIEKKAPFEDRISLELPKEFYLQFSQLVEYMHGDGPKKLIENAKTNIYPQKSLLPKSVNLFILCATSSVYALSRLTILALALSSLRSMPDEVYVTTWTENIPAVQ